MIFIKAFAYDSKSSDTKILAEAIRAEGGTQNSAHIDGDRPTFLSHPPNLLPASGAGHSGRVCQRLNA